MAVLPLAAVLVLATNPACGAAVPGSEFAHRLAAIAIHESAGDALVLGVNADPTHGLSATMARSATVEEAVAKARSLIAQGRSIDLGLMQINSGQLARHGLTVETAFDACRSMKAGADHYADDVRAVWGLAARRYNTGGIERGQAYAASIEAMVRKVQFAAVARPGEIALPTVTVRPPEDKEDDMTDLLHDIPRPPNVSPAAEAPSSDRKESEQDEDSK